MLGEYPIQGRRASEISASVEQGVAKGALSPGEQLPPVRGLAAELGVDPNTVAAAYRTLRDRGVIETAGRRGSRIRARPASAPRETIRVDVPSGVRDVSRGNPDTALLPDLAPALAAAAAAYGTHPPLYGDPPLDAELESVARAAFRAEGVPDGGLAVTSGALDAIERVLGAHLRPGDAVAVEDPGWGSLLDLIPALGLCTVPVAVDDDGPLPGDVERAVARGARALVVTCRAQNPTGASLSRERAAELRTLLAAHPQLLLIEDDHGHGIVSLPLHALAGSVEHWALVRSTAKAYGPDLRLAVLTGDRTTVDRVQGRQRLGPGWVSHLLQRAVVHLWRTGAVNPAFVAGRYGERRDALLDALRERGVRAHGRSGMNVWLPVPDETVAVARLLQSGWAVAPGARFRISSPPGVRVTVSPLTPDDIGTLADALAASARPGTGVRYG
ncbi:aminotransferase class I/II-fold pyridoxal phosphate-dependent enzyme [Streptomyces meridianus]|uniref:Aminotransferase class I/II-fold pyridoxal phosphate-dependent enzyme n=1 Tax=Streptomyces meridianus TaxID=2938945 RepID=A0ABT0X4J2_9ACTN|nr:aminotransferase class I/II-fold pyridoxal phosphate-dependent enzyme [Streptomyces meridianus]MCM2577453.1 aminotransferase class I/II-fold pyridoxal phosphate-dependent enzyme [Streptomyces meridianus]